jgi:L-ascorbate metabolism protein UlaG (beta-lactamase superfamily)
MKYTYLGHSCFQLEINGITIIVDPFIRYNPKASHIDASSLRADFIFISLGHQDHVA